MKSSTPVVSVCVVTYNHEKFISRCMDGILMQKTDFPVEVIVSDDCSNDRTPEILRNYAQKYPEIIKPIFLQKNVGASINHFQFVYPRLTGKYVAICDGDDYWTDPLKLQKQVELLENNPHCVICFHRADTIDQNGNIIIKESGSGKIKYYSPTDILHLSIPTLTVMYRNFVRDFPNEIYSVKSGDTFLFGMLSSFGGAICIDMIAACYRIHVNGIFQGQPVVNRYRQALHTRKVMVRSSYFTDDQKSELRIEVRRRKLMYMKQFAKRAQFRNFFRIMNA